MWEIESLLIYLYIYVYNSLMFVRFIKHLHLGEREPCFSWHTTSPFSQDVAPRAEQDSSQATLFSMSAWMLMLPFQIPIKGHLQVSFCSSGNQRWSISWPSASAAANSLGWACDDDAIHFGDLPVNLIHHDVVAFCFQELYASCVDRWAPESIGFPL